MKLIFKNILKKYMIDKIKEKKEQNIFLNNLQCSLIAIIPFPLEKLRLGTQKFIV